MYHFFLVALISLGSIFGLSNNWVTTKIDDQITIDFPIKASKDKSKGFVVFSSANDHCVFILTTTALSGKDIGSGTLDENFLKGVLDASLESSGAEEIELKDSKIQEVPRKDAKYKGNFPGTDTALQAYKQVFSVGKSVYIVDCWILEEENTVAIAEAEKFFSSIKIQNK